MSWGDEKEGMVAGTGSYVTRRKILNLKRIIYTHGVYTVYTLYRIRIESMTSETLIFRLKKRKEEKNICHENI